MTTPVNNQYGNNYGDYTYNQNPVNDPQKAGNTTGSDKIPQYGNTQGTSNSGTPYLPASTTQTIDYDSLIGIIPASFSANMLAIVQETMNEQRQLTQATRYDEHMAIASKMETQADEIREKAAVQLAFGLISAAISFVASAYSTVASGKALAQSSANAGTTEMSRKLASQQLAAKNENIQGITGMINSTGKIFDSVGQFIATSIDAEIKEIDAQIERDRANIETLSSLLDSLKEVLAKARETQNSIATDVNQTKRHILTA